MSGGTTTLERRAPPHAAAWAAGAAVVLLAAAIYPRAAVELARIWRTNENYSHGPLVPFVSLWLVWRDRRALRAAPRTADSRGLLLVGFACALDIAGVRGDVLALQTWSFPLLLAGLTWTFFGTVVLTRLRFPIGFLFFLCTFPPIVVNQLSYALKDVALRLAARAAIASGVALQRSGMTLELLTGELRVENPCSGLRSLIALLATGALFAHLQPGSPGRRALVFLAAIPIAICANAIRLWLLIVAAHYRDVTWATGRFHDVAGYVLYVVALAMLLAVRAALMPRRAKEAA